MLDVHRHEDLSRLVLGLSLTTPKDISRLRVLSMLLKTLNSVFAEFNFFIGIESVI